MDQSIISKWALPHYLESLMQAGQQATRQFDDALAAAMGVEGKPAKGENMSPFAVRGKPAAAVLVAG